MIMSKSAEEASLSARSCYIGKNTWRHNRDQIPVTYPLYGFRTNLHKWAILWDPNSVSTQTITCHNGPARPTYSSLLFSSITTQKQKHTFVYLYVHARTQTYLYKVFVSL